MNKTVYIREEDEPIWEQAKEFAGAKGVSSVIMAGLKRFVESKVVEAKGFERILLEFNDALDHGLPKKKAFYGRWIVNPSMPIGVPVEDESVDQLYSVAETAKGGVVVYTYNEGRNSYGEEYRTHSKFLVYSSLQEAAADDSVNTVIRLAALSRGVPVEELDI